MVKNMSQKQSNAGMTLAQARDDEMEFFGSHPLFSKHVKKPLFGVNNLVFSLTKLLVACIKRAIPVMISDVKRLLDNAQHDLTLLGIELPRDLREQQSLLVKKISAFCQLLRHSSRGEYRDQEGVLATHSELRLHSVVQNVFKKLQDGKCVSLLIDCVCSCVMCVLINIITIIVIVINNYHKLSNIIMLFCDCICYQMSVIVTYPIFITQ
jgi:hypothetical protein